MNQRTAKLIRRYAFENKFNERKIKRIWNRLPWNKRAEQRRGLTSLLNND